RGRACGAGGGPTIRARIVSAARIQVVGEISSAPDDHFTAGPHCSVQVSGGRGVDGACSCPSINARACPIEGGRYSWKSVTIERRSICFTKISWLALRPADILVSQGRRKQTLHKRWPGQALGY